jgi:hypothetical protein
MPSSKALTNVNTGAGKLHSNVASAAADFQTSNGSDAIIASMVAALNQEIASPTFRSVALTAGATFVTLDASLYGPVWMGATGEVAKDLFDLVEVNDDTRVSDTNDLPLYVTGVAGAAVASNSFTTNLLTINFSGAIPATTNYRLLYSRRMTLGAFTNGSIATARRFVPEPAILEQTIYGMKWNVSGIGGWSDPPSITLREAALSGLGERYNRASTIAAGSPVLNGPGDGAIITRTGQAVQGRATANTYDYSAPQPDPYQALFMTRAGPQALATTVAPNKDGGTGFVGVLQQRTTASTLQYTNTQSLTVASRMDVIERYTSTATIGAGNVKTKINPSNSTGVALNPDNLAGADDRRTILLGTGDYFWEGVSGNDLSEVAIGHDMIEITLPGGEVQTYVITTLFGGPHPTSPVPAENARRALVRTLSGDSPNFPATTTAGVTFRFIKTRQFSGVGAQAYRAFVDGQTDPVRLNWHYIAGTPPITDDPTGTGSNEVDPTTPGVVEIYAEGQSRARDFLHRTPVALAWGGHSAPEHTQQLGGLLRGDGAVECTQTSRRVRNADVSTTSTVTWHPSLEGSILNIRLTHGSGAIVVTVALDADYLSDALDDGDELTVVIRNSDDAPEPGGAGGTATATFVWPSQFKFSGVDGVPNPNNGSGGTVNVSKYHGVAVNTVGVSIEFLMTLTSYLTGA